MTKSVFISRDPEEFSEFATRLRAEGWQVHGFSLVTLTPLPVEIVPEADWIFFASKNAVRFFFEGLGWKTGDDPAAGLANPTPNPSPKGEGRRGADTHDAAVHSTSPSLEVRNPTPDPSPKGDGGRGADTHDATVHATSPSLQVRNPTTDPSPEGEGRGGADTHDAAVHATSPSLEVRDPIPDSSPKGDGGRGADTHDATVHPTSPLPFRGGVGGGVSPFRGGDGGGVLWAALGPATARELLRYTHCVDFTGSGDPAGTAAAFLPLARGKRVLFPAARHSEQSVSRLLGEAITALHLAVYDNEPLPDPPFLDETILVFTSPMNARAYFARHSLNAHQRVVAIGQTTASALRALGIINAVMSKEPAEAALADTVLAMG